MTTKNQVRFFSSEEWLTIMPHANATALESAEHAIYLHGLRHARNVREMRPGFYRGMIGRRRSPTVEVRTVER